MGMAVVVVRGSGGGRAAGGNTEKTSGGGVVRWYLGAEGKDTVVGAAVVVGAQ